MEMNIEYRRAACTPEDLKRILIGNWHFQLLVPEQNPCISIVAFRENEPIGVVIGYESVKEVLLIHRINVSTGYQRKGIGTQLLIEIEEVAKQKSFTKLNLIACESNLPANALYRKHGFVEISSTVGGNLVKHIN